MYIMKTYDINLSKNLLHFNIYIYIDIMNLYKKKVKLYLREGEEGVWIEKSVHVFIDPVN